MSFNYINRKLDDFNEFLYGRKVAIIGLDKESLSIIDYLHRHSAKISIFDTRTLDTLNLNIIDRIIHYNIQYSFGEASLIKLKNVDMIIKSPEYRYDIKEIYEEESRGAIVTSVQELLIDLFPGKIIGITGNSDNEVFNFISSIAYASGYECIFDNDINKPLLTRLYDIDENSILLMEFNEKQLLGLNNSPDISIITNMTQNYNPSFMTYDEYEECIKNMFRFQKSDGITVLNADDELVCNLKSQVLSNTILYSESKKLDNGIIYDENMIKLCKDGVRRHMMKLNSNEKKQIKNICASFATTLSFCDLDTQVKAISQKIMEHIY